MKRNVLVFINRLQSYKTAIKNLHWSSKNMSEHKLWDEIADTVADTQDEVAEIAQGIFGNIKLNELKPRRYNITNSKKTLTDMVKDTKQFYSTVKRGENNIGIRSVVENFIGELEKYQYLMDFCLKEDIKRNIKTSLNENNYKSTYHKMMAAKHAAGKSSEQAKQEMSDWFAKNQAIADINKEISKKNKLDPHNAEFDKAINYETFNADFDDLDYVDPYMSYSPYDMMDYGTEIKPRPFKQKSLVYQKPDNTELNNITASGQDIKPFDDDTHYYDNKKQGKYLESKQNTKIKITESELRNLIKEVINNVLTDDRKQDEINASWDAFEKTRQPQSKYSIKGNLDTELDGEPNETWYGYGKDKYDDVMNADEDDMYDNEFVNDSEGYYGMQAQSEKPADIYYFRDRYSKPKRNLEQYV